MEKTIIFIIPTLTGGGAERVVSNLSLQLPDEINTKFLLFDGEKVTYEYKGEINDLGISISENPVVQLIKGVSNGASIFENDETITVISFLDMPNVINLIFNYLNAYNGKTILSVRNFKSRREKDFYVKIHEKIIKLTYNKADSIVALSKGVKEDLINHFGIKRNKIKVIYNPCDVSRIRDSANENIEGTYKELFKSKPIITSVGSLTEQKGHWHLIRAFNKVKKKIPRAKLILLGDGQLKNYLSKLIKRLNLENDVILLGFQDNPFKFLAKSDLFVLSSLWEGFGNVITEAMACGLSVISTDCRAGPREILAPDTNYKKEITNEIEYGKHGILTPVCDGTHYKANDSLTQEENLLANAITEVLTDKKLRHKYEQESKKRATEFKPEKIIENWLTLIDS